MRRLRLTRPAVIATLAAAVVMILGLQTVSTAPLSTIDPYTAELMRGAPAFFNFSSALERKTTRSDPAIDLADHTPAGHIASSFEVTGWRKTELLFDYFSVIPSFSGLFDTREFELNVSDDKYKPYSNLAGCVFTDNYLRSSGGGREECGVMKPREDESGVLTLPFLAVSSWALVIFAIAGLYHFYGHWRVRWWLRRMRARGVAIRSPNPRSAAPSRARRSSSRSKPRSRRYAG